MDPAEKQIFYSVQYGRKCTFHVFDCEPVTGYVAAVGIYDYLVIYSQDGEIRRSLIHKGSTPIIELHEEPALEAEPDTVRAELMKHIGPLRHWVNKQFSRTESR